MCIESVRRVGRYTRRTREKGLATVREGTSDGRVGGGIEENSRGGVASMYEGADGARTHCDRDARRRVMLRGGLRGRGWREVKSALTVMVERS